MKQPSLWLLLVTTWAFSSTAYLLHPDPRHHGLPLKHHRIKHHTNTNTNSNKPPLPAPANSSAVHTGSHDLRQSHPPRTKTSSRPTETRQRKLLAGGTTPLQPQHDTQPSARLKEEFPEGYVALCVIVKDQAADLREWLQYHRWIGISRVYLFDNNSTRPLNTSRQVKRFMQSGFVHYSFVPSSTAGSTTSAHTRRRGFAATPQGQAYNRCIRDHRHQHRWLGFIDADEFVILHGPTSSTTATSTHQPTAAATNKTSHSPQQQQQQQPNISRLLSDYEGYGALAMNWVMFGSGHQRRPAGGVLVNYKKCMPLASSVHQHVKVFANTAHVSAMGGTPHNVMFKDSSPAFTVNEAKQRVDGPFSSPPSHTRASVYHYVTKSKKEYLQKMKRGAGDGTRKNKAFYTSTNAQATAICLAGVQAGLGCCADMVRQTTAGNATVSRVLHALDKLAPRAVDLNLAA